MCYSKYQSLPRLVKKKANKNEKKNERSVLFRRSRKKKKKKQDKKTQNRQDRSIGAGVGARRQGNLQGQGSREREKKKRTRQKGRGRIISLTPARQRNKPEWITHIARTLSRAAQRSKTRARRESRREKLRGSATIALTNPINGDIDCSLVQTPREIHILPQPSAVPLFAAGRSLSLAVLFLIPLHDLSLLLSLFLARELEYFSQAAPPPPFLFFRSRSLARLFLGGEGARPGGDG